ncbi:MAG: hypothetical protein GY870_04050 [archaeon]|nr:hypothetical protein [archaeon]
MSGKEIAGSVCTSVVLISVILFFGGSYFFPRYIPNSEYGEFSTHAELYITKTFQLVPDTELNISVRANSKIAAEFNTQYLIEIYPTLNISGVNFEVSLVVEGIGNRTTIISYFPNETMVDGDILICDIFSINYVTSALPKGEYTISVFWRVVNYNEGDSYLEFCTPSRNYTRSLWVQEIIT